MRDLNNLVKGYLDTADGIREHLEIVQRGISAANSIGQEILAHPEFKDLPAEMQEKFHASQVSAAEMMKMFEGGVFRQ